MAVPIPETSPPPPTGTRTVRTSGRSSAISRPIVPCPAIVAGWAKGCRNTEGQDRHVSRSCASMRSDRDNGETVVSGADRAHAPPAFGVRELGDSVPHAPDLERPESLEVLQLEPHVLVSRERDGWRMPANLPNDRQRRVDIAERHRDSFHRDILAARGRPAGTIGSSQRAKAPFTVKHSPFSG